MMPEKLSAKPRAKSPPSVESELPGGAGNPFCFSRTESAAGRGRNSVRDNQILKR